MSIFGTIASVALPAVGKLLGGKIAGKKGASAGARVGEAVGKILSRPGVSKSTTGAISGSIAATMSAPAWFDPGCYLENNPDVGMDPVFAANPYLHYTRYGMDEGRNTACRTPTVMGGTQMSILPALGGVASRLPTILPGVGTVIGKAGRAIGGAIGGAVVVDQMGKIIGTRKKRRTMNVLNPRAGTRAIRRIKGIQKFCKRMESALPKQRTRSKSYGAKKCR